MRSRSASSVSSWVRSCNRALSMATAAAAFVLDADSDPRAEWLARAPLRAPGPEPPRECLVDHDFAAGRRKARVQSPPADERDALWARVEAASFLSDDEKREAVGYQPRDFA